MSAARVVLPTDLVALATFDGRVYPNEAVTRDRLGKGASPHPIGAALEQWFSFATGRHTWISVRGATLRGLLSARRRGSRLAWELDCLIDAAEDDPGVLLSLLDQAVHDAGRAGAEKVFLRLDARSEVLPAVCRAGFMRYLGEELYERAGTPIVDRGAASRLGLRRRHLEDRYPLFQLYNAVVPESVRRVEAATFREWLAAQERISAPGRASHLVLEREGRLVAWIRVGLDGETGRFDLLVHPSEGKLDDLLAAALARLGRSRRLYALLPEYAEGLGRRLTKLGFRKTGEYALLVRRTVAPVKVAELAIAGTNSSLS
jgi:hypothetical protein